jgi:hypothetical protein
MLPLTTAWAFTVWKAQVQTFLGPVVLDLGKDEKEYGLAYVAFSCVTWFANIGLRNRITLDCLTRKNAKQSKIACRLIHERLLNENYENTKLAMVGYIYTPSNV